MAPVKPKRKKWRRRLLVAGALGAVGTIGALGLAAYGLHSLEEDERRHGIPTRILGMFEEHNAMMDSRAHMQSLYDRYGSLTE